MINKELAKDILHDIQYLYEMIGNNFNIYVKKNTRFNMQSNLADTC